MATIVGLIPPTTVMFEDKWKRNKSKGKGKSKQDSPPRKLLKRINDLPPEWWTLAANGQHGYNYRTEVTIAKEKVVALLDGGLGSTA